MGPYRNHLVSEVIQYTEKQLRIIKGVVPGVQRGRTRRPRASSSWPSARRSCSSCSPRSKGYYHSDFLNRYFLNRYEEGKKNIKEQESNNTIIPSMWPSPYSQHMAIPLCILYHFIFNFIHVSIFQRFPSLAFTSYKIFLQTLFSFDLYRV